MFPRTYFSLILAALTVSVTGFPRGDGKADITILATKCNNGKDTNTVFTDLDIVRDDIADFDYNIEQLPTQTPPYNPSDFLFYYTGLTQFLHSGALNNRNASALSEEETSTLGCFLAETANEVDDLIKDLIKQRYLIVEMFSDKDLNYAQTISLLEYHTFEYTASFPPLISDAGLKAQVKEWEENLTGRFEELRQAYSDAA